MPHSPIKSSDTHGVRHLEVEEDFAGQRVDNYLMRILKGVPKSRIYRIIRKGEVRLNGKRVKPDTRLVAKDILRVPPVRTSQASSSRNLFLENSIEKTIIYESKLLLIINKPVGVAVHGGSGLSAGVIESLRQARPEEKHLELVHRLDRGTSGCLMIARKRSYLKLLQNELRQKTRLKKVYQAIVHGKWPRRRQHVDAPLRKSLLKSGERISKVDIAGKESLTKFQVLACDGELSLLQASPITGRTHQIRVHCRHIGCPIVGDDKYGFDETDKEFSKMGFKRLMLHAQRLEIPVLDGHPAVQIEAPMDKQFEDLSEIILNNNK